MQDRDRIVLLKVLQEIEFAQSALSGLPFDDFSGNDILKHAVAMAVVNIGELIKNITPELKRTYPNVAWKEATGFRDILAHHYGTIDFFILFETVVSGFPEMKTQFETMLEKEEKDIYINGSL